jgi:hypothetical protein
MADLNILVTDGEEVIVDLLVAESYYVHFGTDGTEAAKADTALIAPSNEARTLAVADELNASTARYIGSITDTTGQTIKELGLFTTAGAGGPPPTGGILIARGNKLAGYAIMLPSDVMEITCTIEIQ